MSHTIKALAILFLIFSDYPAWASKILVKEYGNYVFQYDQTTNQIINDRSKFNISCRASVNISVIMGNIILESFHSR